jgi:hypothetical protein
MFASTGFPKSSIMVSGGFSLALALGRELLETPNSMDILRV